MKHLREIVIAVLAAPVYLIVLDAFDILLVLLP